MIRKQTELKITIAPKGRDCKVLVDGEDVSSIVQRIFIDADAGGPTQVTIWALATNEGGNPYANPERSDVVRSVLLFEDPKLIVDGNVEAANFLKTHAKRCKKDR